MKREPEAISFPDVTALDVRRDTGGEKLLVEIHGTQRWVPQSVITDDSEVWKKGDTGVLVVFEWWCVEDGWFGG